jgi:hypothetical protein
MRDRIERGIADEITIRTIGTESGQDFDRQGVSNSQIPMTQWEPRVERRDGYSRRMNQNGDIGGNRREESYDGPKENRQGSGNFETRHEVVP